MINLALNLSRKLSEYNLTLNTYLLVTILAFFSRIIKSYIPFNTSAIIFIAIAFFYSLPYIGLLIVYLYINSVRIVFS